MNLSDPLREMIPGVRGELLHVLLRLSQPVTRRRLAELADVSPSNASSVVEELISLGLVGENKVGSSSLVAIEKSHITFKFLFDLWNVRQEFIALLREKVANFDGVLGAWLFGSVARGDSTSDSDIDILLVLEDLDSDNSHDFLTSLHCDAMAWTGNEMQITEHTLESFQNLVDTGNDLIAEIRRDGVSLSDTTLSLDSKGDGYGSN